MRFWPYAPTSLPQELVQRRHSRTRTEAGNVIALQSSPSPHSSPFQRGIGLLSSPSPPASLPAHALPRPGSRTSTVLGLQSSPSPPASLHPHAIHRAGRPTVNDAVQEAALAGSIHLVGLLLDADPRTSVTYPVLVTISATTGPAATAIRCMLVCPAVRWGWADGWTKVQLFRLFVTVRSLGGHSCPAAKLLGLRMRKVWGKEMMALLGFRMYQYPGRRSVGAGV